MPTLKAQTMSKVAFQLWAQSAETAYDLMLQEARQLVIRLRAAGVTPDQIMSRIETMIDTDTGFLQTFRGSLQGGMDDLTATIAQAESNAGFDPEEKLLWVLDPTAKEHCDDCVALSNEDAKLLAEWEDVGLPGMGNTECDGYCKCTLLPEGGL